MSSRTICSRTCCTFRLGRHFLRRLHLFGLPGHSLAKLMHCFLRGSFLGESVDVVQEISRLHVRGHVLLFDRLVQNRASLVPAKLGIAPVTFDFPLSWRHELRRRMHFFKLLPRQVSVALEHNGTTISLGMPGRTTSTCPWSIDNTHPRKEVESRLVAGQHRGKNLIYMKLKENVNDKHTKKHKSHLHVRHA